MMHDYEPSLQDAACSQLHKAQAQQQMECAANQAQRASIQSPYVNSGHIEFTRTDGAVEVRISRYLSPDLARKVEATLRALIEADDERQMLAKTQASTPNPERGYRSAGSMLVGTHDATPNGPWNY